MYMPSVNTSFLLSQWKESNVEFIWSLGYFLIVVKDVHAVQEAKMLEAEPGGNG